MSLTAQFVRVAALIAAAAAGAAGCSTTDSGGTCGRTTSASVTITSAQACQMIEETGVETFSTLVSNGQTCQQVCPTVPAQCSLPASYVSEAQALNPDAGASPDGGPQALRCPSGSATLTVKCSAGGCG